MPQKADGLRYRNMYRQCGKILVRRKSVVIGTFGTEEAAARALAAHEGVSLKALPLRPAKRKTTSRVKAGGVYENSGKYEVRVGGQYHGRFETTRKAAAKLSELRGGQRPAPKLERRVCKIQRFKELKRIFKTWRPADITDLIQLRKSESAFCLSPGPLYVVAVMGKDAPWRASILRLWYQMPLSEKVNLCLLNNRVCADAKTGELRTDAAQAVYKILVAACYAMTLRTAGERTYWATHVNRNVAHHSGWLPMMQRIGILVKTSRKTKEGLIFGAADDPKTQSYKIVPFTQSHEEHVCRLGGMQQCLMATTTPKTIDDWIDGLDKFKIVAAVSDPNAYGVLWTYRAAMIAERAAAGMGRLAFGAANTIRDIASAFPDQSRWIENLARGGKYNRLSMPIGEFLRTLGYMDSVEFLTMDLCIFMTVAPGSPASDVRDLERSIQMHMGMADKIAPECGFAHPALVVRGAMGEQEMEP